MTEPEEGDVGRRVVFDTGIVLQAMLSDRGPAYQVLQLLELGRIEVYISPRIRSEYEEVLYRPSIRARNPFLTPERAQEALQHLDQQSILVPNPPQYLQFARDPDDEPVLNLAIHVRADYIVTRDRDLLDLERDEVLRRNFPFLRVVDPAVLLQELSGTSEQQ